MRRRHAGGRSLGDPSLRSNRDKYERIFHKIRLVEVVAGGFERMYISKNATARTFVTLTLVPKLKSPESAKHQRHQFNKLINPIQTYNKSLRF